MNALSLFVSSLAFLLFNILLCSCNGRIRRKVEKAHDQLQSSVFDNGEINAAKDGCSVSRRKRETPSQIVAKAVDFRGSTDDGVGKSFLHSGNQRLDRILACDFAIGRAKLTFFRPH